MRINTGCKLLEWCIASHAKTKPTLILRHFIAPCGCRRCLLCVSRPGFASPPGTFMVGAPFAFLWLISPAVAWWLSKPIIPPQLPLTEEDLLFLRIAARRTWRFFETFVGPTDNYLPPDNFRKTLREARRIAHPRRTSDFPCWLISAHTILATSPPAK